MFYASFKDDAFKKKHLHKYLLSVKCMTSKSAVPALQIN